jgi:hypothetical protein
MAQPIVQACEGATVFASADAVGTLIGLAGVGRSLVVGRSPSELISEFLRLRRGAMTTAIVPYPADFLHSSLPYFAGLPRRIVFPGRNQWAASERIDGARELHPVDGNWQLALAALQGPMAAAGSPPRLDPPESVRRQVTARWPSAFGGGRRPLLLIPGGGGWSSARRGPLWPAERFAVVANQSSAEGVVLLSGVGDEHAVRETRSSIVKPTTVINLPQLTVEEAAVISELSLAVIGHDGDLLHTAAAAGALVLAIGRAPDVPPLGARVISCWLEDFNLFPARQLLEVLAGQVTVDTYA